MQKIKLNIKKHFFIYFTIFLTLIIVVQLSTKTVCADSTSNASNENSLRVGLFFKDKKTAGLVNEISSFSVSSMKGLEVGYINNGQFNKFSETNDNSSLVIRKDTFFIYKDNLFKEYIPNSGNENRSGGIGPFHIQVGDASESYTATKEKVDGLKQKGINAYPAFTDSWYVWVGFYVDQLSTQLNVENMKKTLGDGKYKIIQPSINNIVINSGKTGETIAVFGSDALCLQIRPKENNDQHIFNINGKNYRGNLEIRRYENSDMTVINELPIEHYLYGVVPCEIQWASHPEALKAQAITARTYAYNNFNKYSNLGFDVCNTVYSQVYGGYAVERESTNKAVDETRNKKLYYNGDLAQVFFFSSSGGQTEEAKNVWSADLPYLQSVEDKYEDTDSKNYIWEKALSTSKIKDIMISKGYDIGDVLGIEIIDTSNAGRVIELMVMGTKGNKVFFKSQCREIFDLPSQWYTISSDANIGANIGANVAVINSLDGTKRYISVNGKKVITKNGAQSNKLTGEISILGAQGVIRKTSSTFDNYIFSGRGYGHAVGMSQQGAKGMAAAGFLYDEILKHYFVGTVIE